VWLPAAVLGTDRVLERATVGGAQSDDSWVVGWGFEPRNSRAQRAVLSLASGERIGTWVPAEAPTRFHPGVGVRWPARSELRLEIEYRKAADKAAASAPGGGRIALYFGRGPLRTLEHRSLACGANPIEHAVELLALDVTAAGAGDSVEVTAVRPDGSVEPLALVRRYLPGYRPALRLRAPMDLPAGSRIDLKATGAGCGAEVEFVERIGRS
jgi:hypothetical protein